MAKKISYNHVTRLFSLIKLFSELTQLEIDEFKKLESDTLVPYRITTDVSKRPRFANDPLVLLEYGGRNNDKDIHLIVHPDTRKFVNFKDIDTKDFTYIRFQLLDKSGYECKVLCKDSDLLATFFSMQYENKPYLRLGEVPVRLTRENRELDFYQLIELFNKFASNYEFFKFYSIKNIFPIADLHKYYISKIGSGGSFEITFDKKSILIAVKDNGVSTVSLLFKDDHTLMLSIDEGEIQKRMPKDVYQKMLDRIFKTKRTGFDEVHVELINAKNIYTSLTTLFKNLKKEDSGSSNIFNTY